MDLEDALKNRFGEARVQSCTPLNEGDLSMLLLELEVEEKKVFVLTSKGLSDYKMPIENDAHIGSPYKEIYFCLPSYWDIDNLKNEKEQWIFYWLQKIAKYAREKNTWFAHGHTIPAGNPPKAISEAMKQEYFMFSQPILLREELAPVQAGNKNIEFLAVVPLYRDEWLYKTSRNTRLFMEKFKARGANEQLDAFRKSVLERKFFKFLPF